VFFRCLCRGFISSCDRNYFGVDHFCLKVCDQFGVFEIIKSKELKPSTHGFPPNCPFGGDAKFDVIASVLMIGY